MYASLLYPWSPSSLTTPLEQIYRSSGLVRTKGTIFLLPPPISVLRQSYNTPPRPQTRMSSGAVALCKHFERGGASSEHGRPHPYWAVPRGSNEAKSRIAEEVLDRMLRESEGHGAWRNVMLLHPGIAVYEIRNKGGWGMRWGLDVVEILGDEEGEGTEVDRDDGEGKEGEERGEKASGTMSTRNTSTEGNRDDDAANRKWKIVRTTFRGFVEPIEGMDHELDPSDET